MIAEVAGNQTAVPEYRLLDHLGSLAVQTDNSGNVTGANVFLPFGQLVSSTTNDAFQFTGLEQDTENSSDHAWFRNYSTEQNRWLRPDPYDGSYDLLNPQSFNRYSYVMNNPLRFVDLLGLEEDQSGCTTTTDDQGNSTTTCDGSGGSGGDGSGSGGDGSGGGYGGSYDPCASNPGTCVQVWSVPALDPCATIPNNCVQVFADPTNVWAQLSLLPGQGCALLWSCSGFGLSPQVNLPNIGKAPSNAPNKAPPVPKPPNPILQYAQCSAHVQNQAKKNRTIANVITGVSLGNGVIGCFFAGPGVVVCEGVVGGLELLVDGATEFAYQSAIYDGETQCMQAQ